MAAVAGAPRLFFIGRPLRRVTPAYREQVAFRTGLRLGELDRHYCPEVNYRTGREWSAWLRGWRRGQEQFKARRAELEALR